MQYCSSHVIQAFYDFSSCSARGVADAEIRPLLPNNLCSTTLVEALCDLNSCGVSGLGDAEIRPPPQKKRYRHDIITRGVKVAAPSEDRTITHRHW